MPLQAGSDFGAYQIVRHIGGGGMAQIYLAKTNGLAGFEKFLALKVINAEYADEQRFIQMLIDEAKISVGLTHVNVAQIFDLGQQNGIYYIAMEYVDGLDVLQLVNGLHRLRKMMPVEAVAYIGRQICSGLHYAHTRCDASGDPLDIVHRDISPQNILVSRAGEVKVVDFGIAKAAGLSTKTQAGVIKGKVNYMAPEQVRGHPASPCTDVFSVGIVMWEMLTSQMVYAGDDVDELSERVRKAEISVPSSVRPSISRDVDALVMRALRPNAAERYQSAHELQVALTKYLSSQAPGYSGADLALLVEEATTSGKAESSTPEPILSEKSSVFSRGERLGDRNSLLFSPPNSAEISVTVNGKRRIIDVGAELTIGRAGKLTLPDARVSRHHASIKRIGSSYIIEDMGSSNGTYVNNVRLEGPRALSDGAVIRVGSFHLVFRVKRADKEAAAGESAPQSTPQKRFPAERPQRLLIVHDNLKREAPLTDELTLSYDLQIGTTHLSGTCAQIVIKNDHYWLEKTPSLRDDRGIKINGEMLSNACQLHIGDSVEIDGMTFILKA